MGLSSTTCGAATATIGVWPATMRVYMYYQQTCDLSYRVLSVITPTSRLYLGKPVRACLLWVMVNGFVQWDLSPHGCFDGGHGDKPSNWGAFCGPYFQTNITMMWLLEAILPLWQGIFESFCSTPMVRSDSGMIMFEHCNGSFKVLGNIGSVSHSTGNHFTLNDPCQVTFYLTYIVTLFLTFCLR